MKLFFDLKTSTIFRLSLTSVISIIDLFLGGLRSLDLLFPSPTASSGTSRSSTGERLTLPFSMESTLTFTLSPTETTASVLLHVLMNEILTHVIDHLYLAIYLQKHHK